MDTERRFRLRGRGAVANPSNRFDELRYIADPDGLTDPDGADPSDLLAPKTSVQLETARTLITFNDSPDVSFDAGINVYRGCEHGCAYCFARPTHEYLGLSAGVDFETKIFVKKNAPLLLRSELGAATWKPQPIGMSGITDPYQPLERSMALTRACLEVLAEARNPVVVITKNALVTRDVDLLATMAERQLAAVCVSLPTINGDLSGVLEPRTSRPGRRLHAIEQLSAHGIPVIVLIAPVIPGLTDHEIPRIIEQTATAGARYAGYVALRLPLAVVPLFEAWLQEHRPNAASKVLERVRQMRGGRLYDARFGARMRGAGPFADLIGQLFAGACRKHGLDRQRPRLRTDHFRRPARNLASYRCSINLAHAATHVPWDADADADGPPRAADDGASDEQLAPDLEGVTEVSEPPLFKVIMHNDHYTTMEFVVGVLEAVFMKTPSEATQIMLAIHRRGQGLCGTFTREIAETKVDRVHSLARQNEFPLRCSLEPA